MRDDPELEDRLRTLLDAPAPPGADPALGPFRDEAAALGFAVDRLVAFLRPEQIWLFGSRAARTHRAGSDFDLLVVLPDSAGATAFDPRRAHEPLLASGIACDVVPCTRQDFEADRHEAGTLVHAAVHQGRRLYPPVGRK